MKKILIFRIGSLGDNLIALPAIYATQKKFPNASMYHLGSSFFGSKRVVGREVFGISELFRGYFEYPNPKSLMGVKKINLIFKIFRMWLDLKKEKFDVLIYLAPSVRTPKQVFRDGLFFKSLGIKEILGMENYWWPQSYWRQDTEVLTEAEKLLRRVSPSDINSLGRSVWMDFEEGERSEFMALMRRFSGHGDRRWVAVGPGSKQPAKIWPYERYQKVLMKLISEYNIWPVVLGGVEDKEVGDKIIKSLNCGYNFAGIMSVRQSGMALERCIMYLGNDTGTMHLAASLGITCVAVFSSQSARGLWFPIGKNHRIFYRDIECSGCGLEECIDKKMECILSIGVNEVFQACCKIIETKLVHGDFQN